MKEIFSISLWSEIIERLSNPENVLTRETVLSPRIVLYPLI
jgi:hypothetical protein